MLILAFSAIRRGFGPLFYLLLGLRYKDVHRFLDGIQVSWGFARVVVRMSRQYFVMAVVRIQLKLITHEAI